MHPRQALRAKADVPDSAFIYQALYHQLTLSLKNGACASGPMRKVMFFPIIGTVNTAPCLQSHEAGHIKSANRGSFMWCTCGCMVHVWVHASCDRTRENNGSNRSLASHRVEARARIAAAAAAAAGGAFYMVRASCDNTGAHQRNQQQYFTWCMPGATHEAFPRRQGSFP